MFAEDRSIADVIRMVRLLVSRAGPEGFRFQMRNSIQESAHDFVRELTTRTTRALTIGDCDPPYIHLDYALSLSASTEEVSDAELSGLLTLDDRYEIFRSEWVEARGSLYGKYGGDRVAASRTSLTVCTAPENFAPSGRRRFFWRCHALNELASMQSLMLGAISHRLADVGTVNGPDERETRRLMAIGEHLIEFPRGLPSHHRKWFYEAERLKSGREQANQFYDVLGALHQAASHKAVMSRMDELQSVRIILNQSQLGTLNLGTIVGT